MPAAFVQATTARARTIVSAASSIMSSCPPTSRCRPSSTRMSRAGIPYFASALREQQERRVDARVAERQRIAVEADRRVHDRHDEILGDVRDREHVDTRLDPHPVAHRDEHFHRRVARTGAEAGRGRIDPVRAGGNRRDRVRDAHREVVVAVEAGSVSGFSASRTWLIRAVTSSGSMWPAESVM